MRRNPCLCLVVLLAVVGCERQDVQSPAPKFHQDLGPYGFSTEKHDHLAGSFTDITFLSDDLLLVTINQSAWKSVQRSQAVQPESKLLLFDTSHNTLLKQLSLPLEKHRDYVKATVDGQFALLDRSGIQRCSTTLVCEAAIPTPGSLLASPRGTRLLVGGNGQTDKVLLDSSSMKELSRFPPLSVVTPGDEALLVQHDGGVYLRLPGAPDLLVPFQTSSPTAMPRFLFLNDKALATFDSDTTLTVTTLQGQVSYRLETFPWWDGVRVSTSKSGSVFSVDESGYTRQNAILHFYDIESTRPRDLERLRVFETSSGANIFGLTWDPRPYLGYPGSSALSPSGRAIAVVRRGILEVFDMN
jgi:hypothetical protein